MGPGQKAADLQRRRRPQRRMWWGRGPQAHRTAVPGQADPGAPSRRSVGCSLYSAWVQRQPLRAHRPHSSTLSCHPRAFLCASIAPRLPHRSPRPRRAAGVGPRPPPRPPCRSRAALPVVLAEAHGAASSRPGTLGMRGARRTGCEARGAMPGASQCSRCGVTEDCRQGPARARGLRLGGPGRGAGGDAGTPVAGGDLGKSAERGARGCP